MNGASPVPNPAPMPLPDALLRSLEGLPGFDRPSFEAVHAEGASRASFRLNPSKPVEGGVEALVGGLPMRSGQPPPFLAPVPWCPDGYGLQPRPAFGLDPCWHGGGYYVQEASSMFLGHAVREWFGDRRGLRVVDVCAAPGGKSTQLAALRQTGLLLSNEAIRGRLPVLLENLTRWGSAHVLASQEDPSALARLPGYFDLMVVDAPCSGSGLFRREPSALAEWSPAQVGHCSRRQRRILADAMPALAGGGLLVYCTCSYSREEDEDIVDWLVREHGMEGIRVRIPEQWGVVESGGETGAPGYRFYPDRLAGEGFFLACLRKPGTIDRPGPPVRPPRPFAPKGTDLADWLDAPEALHITAREDTLIGVPAQLAGDVARVSAALRLRRSGLRLGRLAHGRLLPDHELAMSPLRHPGAVALALDREEALRYLRKETFPPGDAPQGWVLATHRGIPLGYLKVMPGRINNAYPSDWRIRGTG